MKTIKCFAIIILLCIIPTCGFAQNVKNDVILTVSADGETKDEAIKMALRSAIEQAYGTFVSANTMLLNDELVKDEIVTISSGNIKEYKEISVTNLPGGKIFVTLRAVVSVSKLINYAQNKGAEAEFAGATFAMNIKMKELNKKNEAIVWNNLLQNLSQLLLNSFDYQLQVEEPILGSRRISQLSEDEQKVLRDALMRYSTNEYLSRLREKDNKTALPAGSYYSLPLFVRIKCNENMHIAMELIVNTLQQLSLTENEVKEYEISKIPFEYYNIIWGVGKEKYKFVELSTRNVELIDKWLNNVKSLFWHGLKNFSIVDNLGGEIRGTDFTGRQTAWGKSDLQSIHPMNYKGCYVNFYKKEDIRSLKCPVRDIPIRKLMLYKTLIMRMNFCQDETVKIIKKEDLGKYTKFEIKTNIID